MLWSYSHHSVALLYPVLYDSIFSIQIRTVPGTVLCCGHHNVGFVVVGFDAVLASRTGRYAIRALNCRYHNNLII